MTAIFRKSFMLVFIALLAGNVFAQQFIDKTWQPLRHAFRRSRDQDDIAALDVSDLTKARAKTVVV